MLFRCIYDSNHSLINQWLMWVYATHKMVVFYTKFTALIQNLCLFILKVGCYTGSAFNLGGAQEN